MQVEYTLYPIFCIECHRPAGEKGHEAVGAVTAGSRGPSRPSGRSRPSRRGNGAVTRRSRAVTGGHGHRQGRSRAVTKTVTALGLITAFDVVTGGHGAVTKVVMGGHGTVTGGHGRSRRRHGSRGAGGPRHPPIPPKRTVSGVTAPRRGVVTAPGRDALHGCPASSGRYIYNIIYSIQNIGYRIYSIYMCQCTPHCAHHLRKRAANIQHNLFSRNIIIQCNKINIIYNTPTFSAKEQPPRCTTACAAKCNKTQ